MAKKKKATGAKKRKIRFDQPLTAAPRYEPPAVKPQDLFTLEKKAEVLSLLSFGYTISDAAQAVGIDQNLIFWAARKDENFAPAYEEAIAQGSIRVENELHRHCFERRFGDVKAIIKYLEVRNAGVWKTRTATELSGPGGKPIEVTLEKRQKLITEILDMVTPAK